MKTQGLEGLGQGIHVLKSFWKLLGNHVPYPKKRTRRREEVSLPGGQKNN